MFSTTVLSMLPPQIAEVVPYWVGGFVLFCVSYWVSKFLSPLLFPKTYGEKMDDLKRVEWDNLVMSTVHAIVISVWCLYLIFTRPEYYKYMDISFGDYETASFFAFSNSYFIVDLYFILRYWNKLNMGGVAMIVHHIIVFVAQQLGIYHRTAMLYGLSSAIMELTTPFVNARSHLDKLEMKSSTIYILNGLMMWLMWLLVRILTIPLFIYLSYKMFFIEIDTFYMAFEILTAVAVFSLNIFWFRKITNGIIKALGSKKAKKAE